MSYIIYGSCHSDTSLAFPARKTVPLRSGLRSLSSSRHRHYRPTPNGCCYRQRRYPYQRYFISHVFHFSQRRASLWQSSVTHGSESVKPECSQHVSAGRLQTFCSSQASSKSMQTSYCSQYTAVWRTPTRHDSLVSMRYTLTLPLRYYRTLTQSPFPR